MMSDKRRSRIEAAIAGFEKKNMPGGSVGTESNDSKKTKAKSKNKKPEAEVVKAIKRWLKQSNFAVNVVEAKATYDPGAGRYTTGQVSSGFSDILACDTNGFACYIEVKAPGKLSTLAENQRVFLIDKINHNAFAGVFDSVDGLRNCYDGFINLRRNHKSSISFLLEQLPPLRKSRADKNSIFPELD